MGYLSLKSSHQVSSGRMLGSHSMETLIFAQTMARYNKWMNERVYECCARLSDRERKEDVGAFFKSIHGTLNHLLLGDRIWLGRFTGQPFTVSSLAEELYAEFSELRMQRSTTDIAIYTWVSSLNEADLNGAL